MPTQGSLKDRPEDAGVTVDRLAVRVFGQIVALGGPHDCELESRNEIRNFIGQRGW